MQQFLTTTSSIFSSFPEQQYKILRCFSGGQFISGNIQINENQIFFNHNKQIRQNCTIAICSKVNSKKNGQIDDKKQSQFQQSTQLTFIIFVLNNNWINNNNGKIQILYKDNYHGIRQFYENILTMKLINYNHNHNQLAFKFKMLSDLYALKKYIENIKNIQGFKTEKVQPQLINTTQQIQQNQQNQQKQQSFVQQHRFIQITRETYDQPYVNKQKQIQQYKLNYKQQKQCSHEQINQYQQQPLSQFQPLCSSINNSSNKKYTLSQTYQIQSSPMNQQKQLNIVEFDEQYKQKQQSQQIRPIRLFQQTYKIEQKMKQVQQYQLTQQFQKQYKDEFKVSQQYMQDDNDNDSVLDNMEMIDEAEQLQLINDKHKQQQIQQNNQTTVQPKLITHKSHPLNFCSYLYPSTSEQLNPTYLHYNHKNIQSTYSTQQILHLNKNNNNPIHHNNNKILSLIHDNKQKKLLLQVQQIDEEKRQFVPMKEYHVKIEKMMNGYYEDTYWNRILTNHSSYTQQHKLLLYSTLPHHKDNIVLQYNLSTQSICSSHHIPSYLSLSNPIISIIPQSSSSLSTFYTLTSKQICLYDTRINKKNHIFTYYNQSNCFEAMDVHRNGYNLVTGINGNEVKIFDLRRNGVVNNTVFKQNKILIQEKCRDQYKLNYEQNQQLQYQKTKINKKHKFIDKSYSKSSTNKKISYYNNSTIKQSYHPISSLHLLRAINKFQLSNQMNLLHISSKKHLQQSKSIQKINNTNNINNSKFKQIKILYNNNNSNTNADRIFIQLNNQYLYFINCNQQKQQNHSQQQTSNNYDVFYSCLQNDNRSFIRKVRLQNDNNIVKLNQNKKNILQLQKNMFKQLNVKKFQCQYIKNQQLQSNYINSNTMFYDYLSEKQIVYEQQGKFKIISI